MSDLMSKENAMRFWITFHSLRTKYEIAKKIASSIAEFDRSDPFAYNRTLSHLLNNVVCPEDLGFRGWNGDSLKQAA